MVQKYYTVRTTKEAKFGTLARMRIVGESRMVENFSPPFPTFVQKE